MSEERRAKRAQMAFLAGQKVRAQIGAIDVREAVEHIRIASLGAIAETRGTWNFLIKKGLATEAERQDALDCGYKDMLEQIEAAAGKVFVATLRSGRGNN